MLDMDKAHFSRLCKEGIITKLPSGKVDPLAANIQYIRHLRKNVAEAKRKDETLNKSAAETKQELDKARIRESDVRTEILRKQRIPISAAMKINGETLSNIAQLIMSRKGKTLDAHTLSDIYSEIRDNAAKLQSVMADLDMNNEARPAQEEEAIEGIKIIRSKGRPRTKSK